MEREDVTAAQARTLLVDKTRLSFLVPAWPQVTYARPDGAIFLWYPGNAVVLQGRWEIRENVTDYMRAGELLRSLKSADVCFQYGANTYNPATAQRRQLQLHAAAGAATRPPGSASRRRLRPVPPPRSALRAGPGSHHLRGAEGARRGAARRCPGTGCGAVMGTSRRALLHVFAVLALAAGAAAGTRPACAQPAGSFGGAETAGGLPGSQG